MSQQNTILTKTQQIYRNIIDKLMSEIKEAATSEGCSEDIILFFIYRIIIQLCQICQGIPANLCILLIIIRMKI